MIDLEEIRKALGYGDDVVMVEDGEPVTQGLSFSYWRRRRGSPTELLDADGKLVAVVVTKPMMDWIIDGIEAESQ